MDHAGWARLCGMTATTNDELVVLLDDSGAPCGSARKADVHHASTPLHLAFSCWLFDVDGRTLLTQRALSKKTWPGIWTNSFCGHPAPGEPIADAVLRRGQQELGAVVARPTVTLPDFRYRAVMDDGIVENEICPVFTSTLVSDLSLDPSEVADTRWVTLPELSTLLTSSERTSSGETYSPWLREQLPQLLDALRA